MERSSSPEQDVALPAAAFTDYLANTLKLSQQSTADLHVFRQVSSGMPEEQLRAAVFLCAMSFRTQQLIEQQNKNFESLTEVLEQVKRAMTHNVAFTDIQKAEMKAACRAIVWDPSRADYTNHAICVAAHAHLKANRKKNGFEDVFNAASHSQMAALNTQLSADASYVKGVLKSSIRKGILDEGDETKHSFTKSLTKTMQKFTGSSTNATVAHGIHFLILRAFARQNKRLLKDTTRSEAPSSEITNTIDSETTTNAEDTNSGNGKVKGTTRKDFFSKLTDFFEQKEDAWGTDTAAGGWVAYINEAIDAELLEHPTDTMPLIPRRSSANTHNTPSNMDVDRGNDTENEPPANASTSNHTRTSAHHSQFAGLFAPGGASA